MRILLVESGVAAPERFVYQCYPPHGLMYLAAFLRNRRPGHDQKILDLMAIRASADRIEPELRDFAPDLVAIHAMSFQAKCMHQLAARVKAWRPGCVVAIGGPHPSAAPDQTLADPNIDIAAIGEGEETYAEIVERAAAGADLAGIPGTVVRRDGQLLRGPERPFIADLDTLPFPAWDLVDLRAYFTDVMRNQNDITNRREVTTIFTSRACPYGCIFCHNLFGKKFRARSVDNVLAEMEALVRDHGIRELHLIDDCFNSDLDRARAIMRGIRERGLDLKLAFPNGLRGDRLPDDLLDLMVAAGVYKMNFGVETGSPRVQKLIKKGLSLDAIRDGISRAAARGIFTHGFFMLGFPGETRAEMEETIRFACSTDLHTAGFALLSPFPGTEVHRIAVEMGKTIDYDPDDTSYMRLSANLTAETDDTVLSIHRRAHWKFYGSPRRIARILHTMPHPSDFLRSGLRHFRLKFL